MIRVRDTKSVPKIRLDPKTGLPIVANLAPQKRLENPPEEDADGDDRRM